MLRFGLFGAGRIGRVHAASLAAHPRTELAVVHDPVEVAAHEIAALYGAIPTGDADAILGNPGIDAVIIASPGGLFRDMTIHDFDMARFFLGDVVEVQAIGANLIEPYIAEAGDVDSAVVSMRGAGGELCQITNSRRCAFGYDQRVEAFGVGGMLSAGSQTATSVRRSGASGTETAAPYLNFFLDRYATAYRAELDPLVICMEQGLSPSPGFADGRAALVLADAATESMKTGRTVRVDS